ncbi:hypothetical protein [Methylocystis sp. ATCC 49242]|uniref:hypothetical protein n=1 Tax=Methylocystis sp. ATCC 49242 TaxID=622637 RepID=UPI001185BC1C|nr:hypothetical protein [Methylocystis sp. ATCC 49242]
MDPPFTSRESKEALEHVKAFVLANLEPGYIDLQALRLVGEPRDVINRDIEAQRIGFVGELEKHAGFSRARVVAFGVAFASLIADRVADLETHEGGRA